MTEERIPKQYLIPAHRIGRKGYQTWARHKCIDCGTERWVETRASRVLHERCRSCAAQARSKK